MHFRPLRSLSALTFASALFLWLAPSAFAAPKDKDAEKLLKEAIEIHYLNADFPKAEKALKDAFTKCGAKGCSNEVLGKLHVALGTVYGVGESKPADAKTEFVEALKVDKNAALLPDLNPPELAKIFEEAKKGGSGSTPPTPPTDEPDKEKPKPKPPVGDATHTPPAESVVSTPLPLYLEPSDDVPLSKVLVRYKPFGAKEYKAIELKQMGKGWGGELPCKELTTTGDVKYFFAFTGADDESAGGLGSSKDPFKTTIKNEIEGDAPKLPGKKPPKQCTEIDCPPGLPGCEPGGEDQRGDKPWGSSCDQTKECKKGLICLNGTCAEDSGPDVPKPDDKKKRMNLIGLGVQFDVLSLSSTSHACDGTNTSFVCYTPGSSNQYFGTPVPFANTDGIQGGAAFAGARILLGYDRQLVKKVGLSLGLRVGYYFGGPQAPGNLMSDGMGHMVGPALQGGGTPPQNPAKGYLPAHVEARLAYHLLGSIMEDKKFRPYVFVGGGLAQVNASVGVALCDSNVVLPADMGGRNCMVPGTPTTVLRTVNAYQITGLNFIGFGGGTTFGITPLFGLAVELKFMFEIPTFGFVFAPNIGPVFNF